MTSLTLFAQSVNNGSDTSSYAGGGGVLGILAVIGLWQMFKKAGKPGWAAIIPFYGIYVMLKMVNRPGWWLILYLIPFVNIITHLVVALDIAKAFGKSTVFGIFGAWLFPFVGYLMLGFGDATYKGLPERA